MPAFSENSLLLGVLANFIFFLFGILFKTYAYPIYKKYTNPLRSVLPFDTRTHKIGVAYGLIPPSDSKKIYTLEEGDALILQSISEVLTTVYGKEKIIIRSHVAIEQSLDMYHNIASMSGPKWNRITENFIGQLGSPIHFGVSYGLDGLVLVNEQNQVIDKFNSKRAPNSIAEKCYGFIISGKIQRSDGLFQNILVCAGNSTLSSFGVILLLRNIQNDRKRAKEIKKIIGNEKKFWGLIIEVKNSQAIKRYSPLNPSYIQLEPVRILTERDFLPPYEYKYES